MLKKKRTEIEKFVLPQPTKEPQIDYKQSKQKRRGKKKIKKQKELPVKKKRTQQRKGKNKKPNLFLFFFFFFLFIHLFLVDFVTNGHQHFNTQILMHRSVCYTTNSKRR